MFSDVIRKYPLSAFFVLAYGFSWSIWIAALVLFPPELPLAQRGPAQLLAILGTFGPFVAAIVVARATGTWSALRSRLLRWRVAPRWYAAALGLPLGGVAVSYGVYRLLGGPSMDLTRALPVSTLPIVFVLTLVAGGGNEEPGWRGFALPGLQARFGPIVGTFVLGVLWAGWHLPAFFDPASSQALLPPLAWALGVVVTSLILTWLFNVGAESVPVVALYHATFNVGGIWVISGLPSEAIGSFYWTGIGVFGALALGLALATRTTLGFVRGSRIGST